MVRFLILYRTPTDIEAFEKHYNEVHIPLSQKLKRLRHYAISRNVRAIRGEEPYYLVAELSWDDMESLQTDFQSPEGQATAEDVSNELEKLSPGIQSMIYTLEDAF